MTVFEAFPNGIEAWKIGTINYSTMTGNRYTQMQTIHVIADEAQGESAPSSANPEGITSDTLLYCQPSELPTISIPALISDYAIKDPDGRLYRIIDAGRGKNQETGELEHIELKVRQTGGDEDGSE